MQTFTVTNCAIGFQGSEIKGNRFAVKELKPAKRTLDVDVVLQSHAG